MQKIVYLILSLILKEKTPQDNQNCDPDLNKNNKSNSKILTRSCNFWVFKLILAPIPILFGKCLRFLRHCFRLKSESLYFHLFFCFLFLLDIFIAFLFPFDLSFIYSQRFSNWSHCLILFMFSNVSCCFWFQNL